MPRQTDEVVNLIAKATVSSAEIIAGIYTSGGGQTDFQISMTIGSSPR